MNFSKFDIVVLMTMSMAIIIMSFTFPALGVTAESPENASDVPQYNTTANPFDIAGEFPDRPGTPSSGTIQYDEQEGSGITGRSLIWIDRPKSDGTAIEIQNDTFGNGDVQIVVTDFNETGDNIVDRYVISGTEGETILHQNTTWTIEFTVDSVENFKQPNMTVTVEFEILESQSGAGGGLSALPVIGGIFDAVDAVASILSWLGLIIRWFLATLFEITISLILLLVDIMTFAVGLMHWLMSTYFAVIGGATSWASVILMVPGILLFAEFVKLSMIGISLLPTT